MTNKEIVDHDPATSSARKEDREIELKGWNREKGAELAKQEGFTLNDQQWEVIEFLRNRYLENGDPESAREVAEDLEGFYADKGGVKALRQLFPGGPVTQGSRFAGLPEPPYSVDPSFGTSY
jgi:tRNA 2-thiouridine synthesizing protein E